MVDIAKSHAYRWLVRDTHKKLLLDMWDGAPENECCVQMDFKQHVTLPVGPVEEGNWWYAHARLAITVLTLIFWGHGTPKTYYTYCSHTLDQSSRYVVACFQDMLGKVKICLPSSACVSLQMSGATFAMGTRSIGSARRCCKR